MNSPHNPLSRDSKMVRKTCLLTKGKQKHRQTGRQFSECFSVWWNRSLAENRLSRESSRKGGKPDMQGIVWQCRIGAKDVSAHVGLVKR
ncbi:hypothetical protein CEXT_97331 [Caerostris extrusa]|uniref:Uncharacterized protein n=1 Tax=Caerostris extrusa TaxID=172846 RepID=A0AAV4NLE6_CAEEX|nr:hypothetical protein CEXT_97331 [Caerostris extrusa]